MPHAEDFDWIRKALARYEEPLLRFAIQLVGRGHAADVVQDTFLALCNAERAEVEDRLAPWLFIVCRNRAFDVLRERQRLGPLEPLDENKDATIPDSQPIVHLERRQSMSRVQAVMEQLPHKHRQVLILKFSTGMSYKQIAEVMDLSVSHVGVLLHNALELIREHLDEGELAECVGGSR